MSTLERMSHAVLYEVLALLLTIAGLLIFTGYELGGILGAMVAMSVLAVVYNYYFNLVFDRYYPAPRAQRGLMLRLYYVLLFEGGLLSLTTPLVALMMEVTLLEALWLDIGITLFVMVYTLVFNLVYDYLRAVLMPAAAGANVAYG
ncbi:PACE efflux transporter [Gilvimarinus japonicus]|uniref:PACE efflux transporter n=1 Tax=Gilvimarinus japonicus TaxID=1796469 RepID=A0ABV7HSX3_9GAMM